MWSGFTWAGAAWAQQPQYGVVPPTPDIAGIVFGGDMTGYVVYGGDASSGEGIVVGGDRASGVVFGGDERAG